jgi:hypothetical protein
MLLKDFPAESIAAQRKIEQRKENRLEENNKNKIILLDSLCGKRINAGKLEVEKKEARRARRGIKYSIFINQLGIQNADLIGKTDLIDWAIVDYLYYWSANNKKSKKFIYQKEIYIWVRYKTLAENLPMIRISDKNALTRRFNKLAALGLVERGHKPDNSLYVRLTELAINIYEKRGDDKTALNNGKGNQIPILPQDDGVSI